MIEGTEINMGGEAFIVPPLNFKRVKRLKASLETLSRLNPATSDMTDKQLEAAIDVVHTALTRNYPDMERDRVEELLDLRNLPHVMAAIMGQSGFVQGE